VSKTSLYRHFNKAGRLLYVGISHDPFRRFQQHADKSWKADVTRVEIEYHESLDHALFAEATAIRDEDPLYNSRRPMPVHPDDVVRKEKPALKTGNWEALPGKGDKRTLVYTILPDDGMAVPKLKSLAASIGDGFGIAFADISERGGEFSDLIKLAQIPGTRILTDRLDAFSEEVIALLSKRGVHVQELRSAMT
jgi:predicted GIY-YIG superfamily endonuclease